MKNKSILEQFLGTVCICGAKKVSRQSHCSACYRSLPKELKDGLWKRFQEGYEEAYAKACEWLNAHRPHESGKLFK